MNKITRDNYEIYFMDYLDGSLSPELSRELKAFLLINRDLEELLEETENFRLPPCPEHFPDKISLQKESCHECPDYYAIAAAENGLTEKDKKALGKRASASTFQSLVGMYVDLRLKPDRDIHFEKKKSLCRKSVHKTFFYRTTGIAAGILVLFGMSLLLSRAPESFVVVSEPQIPNTTVPLASTAPIITPQPDTANLTTRNRKNDCTTEKKKSPTQRERSEAPELSPINIAPPLLSQAENNEPQQALELTLEKTYLPEIYLSENANNWKHSGTKVLSENIITSAIAAGKELTGNIKQKIAIYRSNKTSTLFVIR